MHTMPDYWFVYIWSNGDDARPELMVVAPDCMPWALFSHHASRMIAMSGAFVKKHPGRRIVFLSDVTRWMMLEQGMEWADFDVDIEAALADLHQHGPMLGMEADAVALAVALCGGGNLTIPTPDGHYRVEDFDVAVRQEILEAVELNWNLVSPGGT